MNAWPGPDETAKESGAAATGGTPIGSPVDPGWIAGQVISRRRRCGMAQVDLAVAAEWSERSIQRLEKGQLRWVRAIEGGVPATRRQLAHLGRLGEALDVDLTQGPESRPTPAASAVSARRPVPAEPAMAALAAAAAVGESAISRPSSPPPPGGRPWWRRTLRLGVLAAAGGALVTGAGLVYATGAVTISFRSAPRPQVTTPITATRQAHPHGLQAGAPPGQPVAPAAPPPNSVALVPPAPAVLPTVAPAPAMPAARQPVARLAALQVVTSTAPAPRPQASFSTTLVDFGSVPAGSRVSRTVTLTNTGTGPLHLGLPMVFMATDLDVATDCTNRTLAPGQHCTFTLTFSPGSGTRLNASVFINDDTPRGREQIDVRGSSP